MFYKPSTEDSTKSNKMHMVDDGDIEFLNLEMISGTNFDDVPSCGSMDSFFDELLRDTHACTHTHTCNPPGPDLTHTHTCFHVHTKIVPPTSEEKSGNNDDSAESGEQKSKKRGRGRGGNREAVRKYRQKKKAHTASLEEEVLKLRVLNQQLLRRLQGQAALEAEVVRLKSLLVDIRGRIAGEIGSFPYQNISNVTGPGSYMIPCSTQCGDEIYCLHDEKAADGVAVNGQGLNGCDFESPDCIASRGSAPLYSCGTTNVTSTTVRSYGNARRKS
ncbi:hypothetical protein RND81_11G150700 [Saponaria officinalis]|uniref:BZIP domain-containing protein n=1 Tax=Saponaria officinalis TaxID=3572 RepID=A0AAW1HMF0_SAPOF